MADVIARLKLESGEFDSKVKRSVSALQEMERECKSVNGTLAVLDDEQKKYIQSIGSMETVSKTARGSLNELKQAFVELSVQYKNLTDEEKKGDFGKNLKASLDQLKQRIKTGTKDLESAEKELGKATTSSNSLGKVVDSLGGKFGVSTKMLSGWGIAIAATGVALKVSKDAFMASEENVDAWGRTVESSKSLYEAFLQSINAGDVGGFLSNMNSIVSAAKDAYDALDALETLKIMNSKKIGAQTTENERMNAMLRTGRYIAPTDGRSSTMKDGQVLSKSQLEKISRQLQGGQQKLRSYEGEELLATRKSVAADEKKMAEELHTSVSEFRKWTRDNNALNEARTGYANYIAFERQHTGPSHTYNGVTVRGNRDNVANPYAQYANAGWTTRFKEEGDEYKAIVERRSQYDALQRNITNQSAQMYRNINKVDGITVRGIMGGGKPGGGKGGKTTVTTKEGQPIQMGDMTIKLEMGESLKSLNAKLSAAQTEYNEATTASGRASAKIKIEKYKKQINDIDKGDFADAYSYDFSSAAKQLQQQRDNQDKKEKDDTPSVLEGFGQLSDAIGGMSANLETLGLDLPDGMGEMITKMQAIIGLITGISTILTAIQTIQTAATVGSFLPFKSGGVVRAANGFVGGDIGYDGVPAILQSGELVLNKAQQGNLASQLEAGSAITNGKLEASFSGEMLKMVLNNHFRRIGKGEIVTSN